MSEGTETDPQARLARHVRQALQGAGQVTLRELCEAQPLQQGLAELVAYLQLTGDGFRSTVDESKTDTITWTGAGPDGRERATRARLPRVIYVRRG
jgi:hypothetical protein